MQGALLGLLPLPISGIGTPKLPKFTTSHRVHLNFPIGKYFLQASPYAIDYPDREISLDTAANMLLFSRSGNKMAKQVRSPADIGALVRSTRKEQNLRQDELAGVSGVGIRFIVDLEAGKPTAQIGKILHVLQILGCSIEISEPGRFKAAK